MRRFRKLRRPITPDGSRTTRGQRAALLLTTGAVMHSNGQWRGVFVIVPTPFNDDLSLDLDGLRRAVRFCLDCGANGLVTPANASEAPYLTDRERQQVVSTVIDEANRKIPVIVGVTSSCAVIAVELARDAQETGADAIIAMPPQIQRASETEIKAYY